MAKGVKFWRKLRRSENQRQKALRCRAEGEMLASIAKSYAVDVSMISRLYGLRRLACRWDTA